MESIDNDNGCTSSVEQNPLKNEATEAQTSKIKCETSQSTLSSSQGKINRDARRIYVSNLPHRISMFKFKFFFNKQMHLAGITKEIGNPVIKCYINSKKKYAFLVFRSVEEAISSLALDGLVCEGKILRIRRPHSYISPPDEISSIPVVAPSGIRGLTSTIVPNTVHKIFIGGLPVDANNEKIKRMFLKFGDLKAFALIQSVVSGRLQCYGLAEYLDHSVTDKAIASLNGIIYKKKKLYVIRSHLERKTKNERNSGPPTRVLCLLNIVSRDELRDGRVGVEMLESCKKVWESNKAVRSVKIPVPVEGAFVRGRDKIFIEFTNVSFCQCIKNLIDDVYSDDPTVITSYYDVDKYYRREF